jgi:hypothetical protein
VKASFIREETATGCRPGHTVTRRFYRIEDGSHIVARSSHWPGVLRECYLFRCDDAGSVTDWAELPGSYHGGLDHERALADGGYEVVP